MSDDMRVVGFNYGAESESQDHLEKHRVRSLKRVLDFNIVTRVIA